MTETATATPWAGPGAERRAGRPRLSWHRLLWSLLYPPRAQRSVPTVSGLLLILLALGIGMAAYNTSNNILFITLSLLLGCLILSGVLAGMNLTRVSWRLKAVPPFRAGQPATVTLEVGNAKRLLPTYGLWFELGRSGEATPTTLPLRQRLNPGGPPVGLAWTFTPARRGVETLELRRVGSLFPFGFLKKSFAGELRHPIIVWPAPVPYTRQSASPAGRPQAGERTPRPGQSGDLIALRAYQAGDSHRLIHWKASARLRRLQVRLFSRESQEAFALHVGNAAAAWPRAEQFELMCALAVTLAEDLFTAGRLGTVAVDHAPPRPLRRGRDLEAFFDCVAQLEPAANPAATAVPSAPRGLHLLTFAPDGPRGVVALVDGQRTATA